MFIRDRYIYIFNYIYLIYNIYIVYSRLIARPENDRTEKHI
jgi:hypothetical protein